MFQKIIPCSSKREGEIIDITGEVSAAVAESGIRVGMCSVFITGSTAAVTTIEYEPGVLADLAGALARFAPADIPYAHDAQWGDGNGRSHVKAALVGPSLSVPIRDGSLLLGTWQQIVLLELDTRARSDRQVIVSVLTG